MIYKTFSLHLPSTLLYLCSPWLATLRMTTHGDGFSVINTLHAYKSTLAPVNSSCNPRPSLPVLRWPSLKCLAAPQPSVISKCSAGNEWILLLFYSQAGRGVKGAHLYNEWACMCVCGRLLVLLVRWLLLLPLLPLYTV